MKATGIVRRIDDLGRVVIPKELRRMMEIVEGDPLEIFTTTDKQVILQKYHEGEPEKNGLEVNAEKEETYKVTLRDNDKDTVHYLTLSKSAFELLYWLEREGCFHYDIDLSEGHSIEEVRFV